MKITAENQNVPVKGVLRYIIRIEGLNNLLIEFNNAKKLSEKTLEQIIKHRIIKQITNSEVKFK